MNHATKNENNSLNRLDIQEGHRMKSVTGYVNQRKLGDLLRELRNAGVWDISVVEYFSQPARISRIRFLCPDDAVERVCSLMVSIASTGTACDHCCRITDVETNDTGAISLEQSQTLGLRGEEYGYID